LANKNHAKQLSPVNRGDWVEYEAGRVLPEGEWRQDRGEWVRLRVEDLETETRIKHIKISLGTASMLIHSFPVGVPGEFSPAEEWTLLCRLNVEWDDMDRLTFLDQVIGYNDLLLGMVFYHHNILDLRFRSRDQGISFDEFARRARRSDPVSIPYGYGLGELPWFLKVRVNWILLDEHLRYFSQHAGQRQTTILTSCEAPQPWPASPKTYLEEYRLIERIEYTYDLLTGVLLRFVVVPMEAVESYPAYRIVDTNISLLKERLTASDSSHEGDGRIH